jgi:Protein of unknown function (DUF3048) N-terminal domain/Protein of unknown function (DUF3048) C-terminal domain
MHVRQFTAALIALSLLFAGCSSDEEPAGTPETPASSPTIEPECSLSGIDIPSGIDAARPAVAIKIENNPSAYPLSGLENAEVVYEELVEGGYTRFAALYHCTDAKKAGPVRSARSVDPGIIGPITKIMGAAGGNNFVRKILKKAKLITVEEDTKGGALRRVSRPGVATEHTLYADTEKVRKVGSKKFEDAPPLDLFEFGSLPDGAQDARTITVTFGGTVVQYKWKNDAYVRWDYGSPLESDKGKPLTADNVLIEQHKLGYSKRLMDVLGNKSIEIKDVTGSGPAALFRDGKVILGRWERESMNSPVRFVTKDGDPMVFKVGTIWIELAPSKKGEVKGGFSYPKGKKKKS